MTCRHRDHWALIATVLIVGTSLLTSGCAPVMNGVKNAARQVSDIPISGWSDDVIRGATRQLQTEEAAAAKRAAATKLTQAGLDFACIFPVDDAADEASDWLNAEIRARAAATAQYSDLGDIHTAYTDASAELSSLDDERAVVFALHILGTYCNLDQAAG